MTDVEVVSLPQQRLEEIEFYNFIRRLLETYENSVVVFDLIDVFATFGELDPTVIKKLIQQVYIGDLTFKPSKEEQLIVYRKKGYSMRQIRDITGMHPNTQYRVLEDMQSNRNLRPTITPRLDEETFMNVRALMKQINKFKEV